MGLSISFDNKKWCSIFTLTGETTFGDIKSELEYFSNGSLAFHRMSMIWDFRRADLSKTQRQQIDKIATYFDQKLDALDKIKVACVVRTDLQYGICRILQFYVDNNIVEIKTFKNYGEAIRWISI